MAYSWHSFYIRFCYQDFFGSPPVILHVAVVAASSLIFLDLQSVVFFRFWIFVFFSGLVSQVRQMRLLAEHFVIFSSQINESLLLASFTVHRVILEVPSCQNLMCKKFSRGTRSQSRECSSDSNPLVDQPNCFVLESDDSGC